jgi:hypothetical protein
LRNEIVIMNKTKSAALAGLSFAAVLTFTLAGAIPAQAESRNLLGVNCQGAGYTTTKTAAFYDYSKIGKYPSGDPSDLATFGPNEARVIQVHNNWTTYPRTTNAIVSTDIATDFYISAAHLCDN